MCSKVRSDHTGVSIMSNDCPTAAGLLLNMAEDNSLHFFLSGDEFYIGGKKKFMNIMWKKMRKRREKDEKKTSDTSLSILIELMSEEGGVSKKLQGRFFNEDFNGVLEVVGVLVIAAKLTIVLFMTCG